MLRSRHDAKRRFARNEGRQYFKKPLEPNTSLCCESVWGEMSLPRKDPLWGHFGTKWWITQQILPQAADTYNNDFSNSVSPTEGFPCISESIGNTHPCIFENNFGSDNKARQIVLRPWFLMSFQSVADFMRVNGRELIHTFRTTSCGERAKAWASVAKKKKTWINTNRNQHLIGIHSKNRFHNNHIYFTFNLTQSSWVSLYLIRAVLWAKC